MVKPLKSVNILNMAGIWQFLQACQFRAPRVKYLVGNEDVTSTAQCPDLARSADLVSQSLTHWEALAITG